MVERPLQIVRAPPCTDAGCRAHETLCAVYCAALCVCGGACFAQGVADYDHRTALHLAASNGHAHVIAYLLAHPTTATPGKAAKADGARAMLAATDRWGNTALDDARREGHTGCESALRAHAQ